MGESNRENQECVQFKIGNLRARPEGTGQVEETQESPSQAKAVSDRPQKRNDRQGSANLGIHLRAVQTWGRLSNSKAHIFRSFWIFVEHWGRWQEILPVEC